MQINPYYKNIESAIAYMISETRKGKFVQDDNVIAIVSNTVDELLFTNSNFQKKFTPSEAGLFSQRIIIFDDIEGFNFFRIGLPNPEENIYGWSLAKDVPISWILTEL